MRGRENSRVRAVAEGHEGEERPVVVDGGVSPLFSAEPALDLGASGIHPSIVSSWTLALLCSALLSSYSPGMMEAHNSHQRHEPPSVLHALLGLLEINHPPTASFLSWQKKEASQLMRISLRRPRIAPSTHGVALPPPRIAVRCGVRMMDMLEVGKVVS